MRDSLRYLIESVGMKAVTFATAGQFLAEPLPHGPGCLLLDVRLPDMSGLELQQVLARSGRHIPVIIITGHGDVPMAVRAMRQGAVDLIEKPLNDRALLGRIRQALRWDEHSLQQRTARDTIAACASLLTRRERQVMELVVAGKPNKQIAAELGVSAKTIEVHRAHVMSKMQASTLADLVRMCMRLEQDGPLDAPPDVPPDVPPDAPPDVDTAAP